MPLYEHVFIARQDISNAQAEELIGHFSAILEENGGKVIGSEYWGLKNLAYRIHKNRKGHYCYLRTDAPAAAVQEMERLMRLHDDVIRTLTVRVEEHEEGASAMTARSGRDDRRGRGRFGDRGGRREGPPRERARAGDADAASGTQKA